MLMQRSGINARVTSQQMPRVAMVQTGTGTQQQSYIVGPQIGQQQQPQLQVLKLQQRPATGQSIIVGQQQQQSPQAPPPNLNVAHQRLLMHQEQQDFKVKPQMLQTQSPDGSFDLNGLNSINNTVAPNVQITVKPRQQTSTSTTIISKQQMSTNQDVNAQMSPRYTTTVVGNNNASMQQVPSTTMIPQSPVLAPQLSPSPQTNHPVSSTAMLRGPNNSAAGSQYNHNNSTVYPSPQNTLSGSSSGAASGGQVPSPFSTTNRMSPGHYVTNTTTPSGGMSASASPSPVGSVSPMISQIASPQSVNSGQPITQINWQQQGSPSTSNRPMSSNTVPSPAQVMSPSSTSNQQMPQSNSPVTPAQPGTVQQSNPMLNDQLSSGRYMEIKFFC